MSIYLTNSTRQNIAFFYHLAVYPRGEAPRQPLNVLIPSGKQETICEGCTPEQISYVIKQLENFGAHDAAEIHRHVDKFHGLLYRHDGLVSSDEILMGHEAVKQMANDRSVSQAVHGVLGAVRATTEAVRLRPQELEVTLEEQTAPGQRRTGDEAAFKVSVTPEGKERPIVKAVA